MKLAAIYNIWNDWDILQYSIRNIEPLVDTIIVVYSRYSNYGEDSEGMTAVVWGSSLDTLGNFYPVEPDLKKQPRENETAKRNFGLNKARELGCTHFIMSDADEFYEPEPFLKEKERFLNNPKLAGLVCQCQTYFKSPKLTIGLDTTLVPFIHKLTPTIRHEFNRHYPFAWEGKAIRIDPTRSLNINSGVERTDLIMHHYSWVRKDFEKKIRNSTARTNLERSSIRKDLLLAKEGYFVEFYQRHLQRSTVDFGIPEFHEYNENNKTALC